MNNKKTLNLVLVIVLFFMANSVNAINLGLMNASVNPNPISASSTFTVSVDVVNSTDTSNPETSNTVRVIIDNFGMDTNANFSFAGNVVGGWTCNPIGTPVTSVECDKTVAIPADDTTIQTLGFDLTAGSLPISVLDFNFVVLDLVLVQDSLSTIDTATINTSVVSGGGSPDFALSLIEIDGNVSLTDVNFPEGSFTAQNVHFRVKNNGGNAANGATLSLFFDDINFSLSSSTLPINWSCAAATIGQIDCSSSMLINSGANFDFFFDFAPTQTLSVGSFASLDVSIADNDFAEPSITQNDNNVSVPVSVISAVVQTDLEVKKFVKDSVGGSIITNVNQDTQFVYSIQVNNLSTVAANNVTVTDNIPPGIEIVSAAQSNGVWSCNVGAFVDINTSQLVTCSRSTMPASQPNSTEFIYLDAFGRVAGASPINNTAFISASDEADSNTGNDSGSADITVDAVNSTFDVFPTTTLDNGFLYGDFGVTIGIGDQGVIRVLADARLQAALALAKSLPVALPVAGGASNVVLTAVIPTGLSYVSHSVVGPGNFVCTYNGTNTVTCTAVNLPDTTAEDGVLITVMADGPAGTSVDFSASVAADPGSNVNSFNDNNSAQTFTITAAPVELDLTVTKDAQLVGSSISNNEFLVGQNFEYRLVAINQNANIALPGDVAIFDVLPLDMNLDATPSSPGWNCSVSVASGTSVDCINTVAIAANGGSLELILPVSSQVAGPYSNTVNIDVPFSSTAFENNTNDNSAVFNLNIVTALSPTSLSVSKDALVAGAPVSTVDSASIYTYRVDVGNTGAADAVNIMVVDTMPAGVSVLNTNGSGWSCSNIGQQYTCNFPGPLSMGSSAFVDFVVREGTPIGTQSVQNNVNVTATNASLQSASNTVSIIRPSLNVSVIQTPNPVEGGTAFNLSVAINNTGNSSLTNVQVENTLPAGFSYGAIAKASSCSQNGLVMTCLVNNSIVSGSSEIIIIPIQAIGLVDANAIYTNTTVVSGSNITAPITNTITLAVNQADFDVGISKSASVSSIAPNSPFNYVLSVSNLGSMDATGVTVVDNLPSGVQFVSFNAPGWTCTGNSQIQCIKNSLPIGSTSDIIINVISPINVGAINNIAQVSIVEPDNNTMNNTSQVGVDVMTGVVGQTAFADLQLTKTTSTPMLVSGEQYSWQIDILNLGPDTASNVIVNDLLPLGFQFDTVTTTSGNCQETAIDLTCEIPFIFNQDTVSIIVTGIASIDSGQLTSTASILSSGSTDLVASNDSGSINVTVNPRDIDLAVTIDSGDNIDQGDSSEFTVNIVNNGPNSAHAPELNIDVSGLIDSISVNQGNDWVCQVNGQVAACQFNGLELINGQISSLGLTVNTSEIVIESEDLVVTTVVSTTNVDIDSNIENNTATSLVAVDGTPTEGEIAGAIRDALGVGDPELNDVIGAVAGLCEVQFFTALEELCSSIYDAANEGNRSDLSKFLDEITPREVIGQSTSLNEIALAQFRNIGARLNQLRGGGGNGFSSAGLTARYGSGSIPLGMLSYLNQSEEETAAAKIDTNNDFISPWGFFVNGTVSMGARDATGRELGFDFDTFGLTAGLDYRIDAKKVVGVAVGYANFDSKIEGSAELNSTGITLTGYGSFYVNDNFYLDARISLGKPEFEQSRKIDFTLGSTRFERTAAGNTRANQYTASMSAGYSFYKNAWNITPNASFTYTSTNVDSFTESGAGDFNIVYSEQDLESLVWSAGIRVSKAVSLKQGVITPQFDFDYNYQGLNDESVVEVRFINAPLGQAFYLETDTPDRSYGSAGLGLVYISANGKQAYFNYRSVLGLEGFSRGTFNVGARFEF